MPPVTCLPEGGDLVGTELGLLILVGGLRPLGFPVLMFPCSMHVNVLTYQRNGDTKPLPGLKDNI